VKGEKSCEKQEIFYYGVKKSTMLLEGSQASPSRPSDKGSVKVKT
jgi:hypothetical protein